MAYGRAISRGGVYNRLAEPAWTDPLDTSYSRQHRGRWNAPGGFGVLYLNRNRRTARLQVLHKLRGQPYGVEDLDEGEQHDLLEVLVTEHPWLDCVTTPGLEAVGLPATYPRDPRGQLVPHSSCRPIGKAAYDDGRPGIACRSAATDAFTTDEELAVFDREVRTSIRSNARQTFAEWFWESLR